MPSNTLRVQVQSMRTLSDPHVEIDLDVVSGKVAIILSETCERCAGYGSPCPACENGRTRVQIEVDQLASKWGVDVAEAVRTRLRSLLEAL